MNAEEIMKLKVSEISKAFDERDRFRSALEEIIRHCPAVPKQALIKLCVDLAREALGKK